MKHSCHATMVVNYIKSLLKYNSQIKARDIFLKEKKNKDNFLPNLRILLLLVMELVERLRRTIITNLTSVDFEIII